MQHSELKLADLKGNLSGFVSEAERGEGFVIMRNGRPVAELIPLREETAEHYGPTMRSALQAATEDDQAVLQVPGDRRRFRVPVDLAREIWGGPRRGVIECHYGPRNAVLVPIEAIEYFQLPAEPLRDWVDVSRGSADVTLQSGAHFRITLEDYALLRDALQRGDSILELRPLVGQGTTVVHYRRGGAVLTWPGKVRVASVIS